MRIAILGSGGVGGYFGGKLAASGEDVSFIARGDHLAALKARGLRIDSALGNLHLERVNATDDSAAIGPVDYVFFAVKLYDNARAVAMLPPLIGAETLVIPFQNGVESVDLLARAIGPSRVAGGTAYVAAVIAEPGLIRHTAMNGLIFGPTEPAQRPGLQRLLEACRKAGLEATLSDSVIVDIWTKFARLSVFSGLTAVTRCSIGPIMADPDLFAMVLAGLQESMAVARGKGIALAPDLLAELVTALEKLPPQARSSMLEDLERGRPLELPWLSGAVVRIGHEVGVETPVHHFITTVLRPHVNGAPRMSGPGK